MDIVNNKIVLFGGIIEITKESDEVFLFDFKTLSWSIVDLPNLYKDGQGSPMNHRDTDSTHGEQPTLNNKQSIGPKKLKHTSSLPLLNNLAEKSKYGTNQTMNSTQFESTMVTSNLRELEVVSLNLLLEKELMLLPEINSM